MAPGRTRTLGEEGKHVSPCKTVLVVGGIGAGKSVLVRELGEELDALVLMEQAQEHGNPYLDDFYKDLPRWAFTLQVHQLAVRLRQHLQAQWHVLNGTGHAVIDAGFWMDTCYARGLAKSGIIDTREYETYRTLFQAMTSMVLLPNIVIRINTSPSVAAERIRRRAADNPERASEAEQVDEAYLAALDTEISGLCNELAASGVYVVNTFWDVDRDTPEQRRQAVEGLARRVREHEPPDPFLSHWRRRT